MSKVENLHTRLKTARIAGGFKTATEFCDKFQIPTSTYNMHETGKRKLMPDVAEKYSDLLGINPAWLITGLGTPYQTQSELEDDSNLTEQDFLSILNYKGNPKISKQDFVEEARRLQVDPTIFVKIVIEIIKAFQENKINININLVSDHAVQIYKDILKSSNDPKEQFTMINLAITILKRNLEKPDQLPKNNEVVTK